MAAQREQLLIALQSLLETGKYSDLTVTCGPDTHKVHRSIVCTRCRFFAGAERFPSEAAPEGTIDLPEDEPDIIRLLIEFLYQGDYILQDWFPHTCIGQDVPCTMELCRHHVCGSDCRHNCDGFACATCNRPGSSRPESGQSTSQLLGHAKMYEIADKYEVTGLKELSCDRFRAACEVDWDKLDFGKIAEYVYTTTPNNDLGLRIIIYDTISDHREIISKPLVQKFLQDKPAIMLRLLTEPSRHR